MDEMLERLRLAQAAIRAQITERNRDFLGDYPGYPWSRVMKALDYVHHLPPEQLRSIRLHCDLFLDENTPRQFFGGASAREREHYAWLGVGVDQQFWAREPVIPAIGEPLAPDGITTTTVNIQRYLCNLLRLGLADGQTVVEIGPGYGGLAESVLRARRLRYVLIDLPETLIFSAAFLISNFPDRDCYVYAPGDGPAAMGDAEIVLLPSYRVDWLHALAPFDWAINTVSFPEMATQHLRAYLAVLRDCLTGSLMSVNYHGANARGVTDEIADFLPVFEALQPPHCRDADRRMIWYRPTVIAGRPPKGALRDIVGDAPVFTPPGAARRR